MSGADLAVLCVAVFVAAATQVLAGFGFALLAVPLMALAVDTRVAVVVSTALGVATSVTQAWHGRSDTDRVLARRLTVASFVGMPLGLAVFTQVNEQVLRLLLGVCVLVIVVLLARRIDLRHAGPRLDWTAGAISGALATSLSTNGPPLVFALQARHLSPAAFRPTINTVFAISGVASLAAFTAASQHLRATGMRGSRGSRRDALVGIVAALPVLVAGIGVGFSLRRHVDGRRFNRLVLVLLAAAGVSAILAAVRGAP